MWYDMILWYDYEYENMAGRKGRPGKEASGS